MKARSRDDIKQVKQFFADKARKQKHDVAKAGKSFSGCEHGTDIRSVECPECLKEFHEHQRVAADQAVDGSHRSGAERTTRARPSARSKARPRKAR